MNETHLTTKIKLTAIDIEAEDISEAIGISAKEYVDSYCELEKQVNSGDEKLPFTEEEAYTAYFKDNYGPLSSLEVTIGLWRDHGREDLSIKEFILTIILLKKMEKKEVLFLRYIQGMLTSFQIIGRPIVDIDMVKQVIKDHGDQVLLGGESCRKYFNEHQDNKGCPSKLGCKKTNLVIRALTFGKKHVAKDSDDAFKMQKSVKAIVDEILSKKTLEELEKVFVPL